MTQTINGSFVKGASFENGNLTVEFNTGRSVTYVGVPEAKYQALVAASSAGRYFNAEIRNKYSTR